MADPALIEQVGELGWTHFYGGSEAPHTGKVARTDNVLPRRAKNGFEAPQMRGTELTNRYSHLRNG